MCNSCKQLHFYSGFRSTLQYFHEISKIRALVSLGDMKVEQATIPLGEVTGEISGYYRHEVRCTLCGQRFAVWIDTESGSGGLTGI
ncbi:MAG: hypothetical protein MR291_09400 [Oscillospiraceae bacterium]|nr:hypothetical protein [Oscillospiraceae bacterium]